MITVFLLLMLATEPATCAECVDDCDTVCEVPACTECGEVGCWIPEGLECEP